MEQALASSPAAVQHLRQVASSASDDDVPLASAISEILDALTKPSSPPRNGSVSPRSVLDAFREYLPADCLRDGEQNDSAEVLELLYNTLATEFAKQASIPSSALQQAQSAWRVLSSMLSASSSKYKQSAMYKLIHQDSPNRHDNSLPLISASSSSSSFSSSISHQPSTTSSDAKATVWHNFGSIAEVSCHNVPLQGTTVNDMMCVKCRHSFTTQHAPFLVLPLALPTTKVTNRRDRVELQRTVVARNTHLQQCLADFCSLELVHGVHCPRCTLRAALKTFNSKVGLPHLSVPASSAVDLPIASHTETPALKAARSEAPVESASAPSVQAAAARIEPADAQLEEESAVSPAEEGDCYQRHGTDGSQCADTDADTQLHKRDVIERLLQDTAPWPDMDYQQLATDAGLKWAPDGTACVKRISVGRAPRTLCLHLRRAFWTNAGHHLKLTDHVNFPVSLDVAPYSAANMLPLSSISQQYAASAIPVQAKWVGPGAPDSSKSNKGNSAPQDAPGSAAEDVTSNSGRPVITSRDDPDTTGRAASPHGDAPAVLNSGSAGPSSPLGLLKAGNSNTYSNGDLALVSAFAGQAAAAAAANSTPEGASDDHTSGDASMTGQNAATGHLSAPGPVQRLLTSHALSLASCLTSESSFLNEDLLSSPTGTCESYQEGSSRPTAAAAAAVAEKLARRVPNGKAGRLGNVQRAGPVQRVLASHALSLASSLLSEGSLLDDDVLGDATGQEHGSPAGLHQAAGDQQARVDDADASTNADGSDEAAPAQSAASQAHSTAGGDSGATADEADDGKAAAAGAAAHDSPDIRCNAQAAASTSGDADISASSSMANADSSHSPVHTEQDESYPAPAPQLTSSSSSSTVISPCPTEIMENKVQDDWHAQTLHSTAMVYHLTAAVVHHGGSSGSGHYTVYRRVQPELDLPTAASERTLWFSISDEVVRLASIHDVLACHATLLFYER
ncbi:TPA: hypothetical protein ACH3X1_003161 [Trebouxia sp. C0004]